MEQSHETDWEQAVAALAQRLEYPPTPDLRRATGGRRRPTNAGWRLVWAMLIISFIIAGLVAVPQTRAALLSFFARIGAIDVFIDGNAPTPTLRATDDPVGLIAPPPTANSAGTVGHSLALFELGEAVGLAEAQRMADFPLLVPGALGRPDEVYVHRNVDLPAVTLVWRDETGAPLSLTEIGVGQFAMKLVAEEDVTSLLVNSGGMAGRAAHAPAIGQLAGRRPAHRIQRAHLDGRRRDVPAGRRAGERRDGGDCRVAAPGRPVDSCAHGLKIRAPAAKSGTWRVTRSSRW